jgi:pyruvate,water dikinase
VPEPDRTRFDELLDDARSAYGLRDDDVGICWNWPLGLIRHAGLEVGRRLTAEGVVGRPEDVFEVVVDEIPALLSGRGPSADVLAARRDVRARAVDPPLHLAGGGHPPAELSRPANVAALEAIRNPVWTVAPPRVDAPLHGIGVGADPVVGPARLVLDPDDLVTVEPGDVLVAVATTTAFNAVFPLVAGVVTAEGSLLSHAAILSRELGVPAVVGVGDVFAHVRAGDLVEVDPAAGSVRVVDRPG